MEILIRESSEEASILAARIVAGRLRRQPESVLGLATGRTPLRLYEHLARMHREEQLDFSHAVTFNLDEYVGLPPTHPQSYRFFMERHLFSRVNLRREHCHLPDGMAEDLRAECRRYEAEIVRAGGIDLQLLGIGGNGHIGFNEPMGSLASRTWVKILSRHTVEENGKLFPDPAEMPRHCITVGIGTILESRHCLLLALGEAKAEAVARMIEGPLAAACPASALQLHPRTTVVLDEAAASRLANLAHYHWVEGNQLPWQKH